MGHGCCNEILTHSDRVYALKEANELAIRIADEMTQENYHIFVTRDYYNRKVHWRMAEGANLDNNWITYIAIKKNYGLDVFIHSSDEKIRAAVGAQGYQSSVLINDKSALVRAGVAQSGYDLKKLINDEEPVVRCAVAKQGYGLDILISDENDRVRRTVAEQGYKTEILVNDKSPSVRTGLAKSGYELKTLMLDGDSNVSRAAREESLKKIVHCENDEEALKALTYIVNLPPISDVNIPGLWLNNMVIDEDIAIDIINKGYCLSYFINSNSSKIRATVAKQGYCLDVLINDKDPKVRSEVAKQGYGLDILIHDEDYWVRVDVVKQGYGLDILVKDTSSQVRECIADQGYGLDILLYDKDYDVRKAVARQGYGLDTLVYDENEYVRDEVARQGYRLDILVKDKDSYVKKAVISQGYCLENLLYDKGYGVSSDALEVIAEQASNMNEVVKIVDSVMQTIPDFIEKLHETTCINLMNMGFPLSYFMKHKHRYVINALVDRGYELKTFIHDDNYQTKQFAIRKLLDSCKDADEVTVIVKEALKVDSNYMNKIGLDDCTKFIDKGCPLKYFSNSRYITIQDLIRAQL
ncbi:hypothetical protein GJV85_08785 [Sulfurimonas aquatica]|uniref:Uncharacterized protein n=1 Tax=Sulfurimonas aquatica TaxID=2672570 RepID=A0A975GDC2_9BACT|nr:HEAT repeat domain-containing protein [Sulfurimonas aquatica]QSZ42203.1 hypothetical protein GJV85_08785 [Sulfurimonas aquatica]